MMEMTRTRTNPKPISGTNLWIFYTHIARVAMLALSRSGQHTKLDDGDTALQIEKVIKDNETWKGTCELYVI